MALHPTECAPLAFDANRRRRSGLRPVRQTVRDGWKEERIIVE